MTTVNSTGIQASMGPWIVSSDLELTNFTTIQSAIDDALAASPTSSEHHTVYIKAGSYTENLTLHPNVDLVALVDNSYIHPFESAVKITGHHSLSGAAGSTCNCSNIYFINTSNNPLFSLSEGGVGIVFSLKDCNITQSSGTTNAIFSLTYTSSGITVNLLNSITSSDYTLFSYSGTPQSLTFNVSGGSLATSTTQATSGTAQNYTVNGTNSSINMNVNNTNSETASFILDKCDVQMAVTNATSGFSVYGTFCNFTYFPTPTGTLSATALIFIECALSDNATPATTSFYSKGRAIVTVSGTSKTFALSDASTFQNCTSGSTTTLTIPTNASVAFDIGTEIDVFQSGAGQVVVAAAGGVTLNSFNSNKKIAAQYTGATLKKVASDTWVEYGNLTA